MCGGFGLLEVCNWVIGFCCINTKVFLFSVIFLDQGVLFFTLTGNSAVILLWTVFSLIVFLPKRSLFSWDLGVWKSELLPKNAESSFLSSHDSRLSRVTKLISTVFINHNLKFYQSLLGCWASFSLSNHYLLSLLFTSSLLILFNTWWNILPCFLPGFLISVGVRQLRLK